jgi:hypothetical protein
MASWQVGGGYGWAGLVPGFAALVDFQKKTGLFPGVETPGSLRSSGSMNCVTACCSMAIAFFLKA